MQKVKRNPSLHNCDWQFVHNLETSFPIRKFKAKLHYYANSLLTLSLLQGCQCTEGCFPPEDGRYPFLAMIFFLYLNKLGTGWSLIPNNFYSILSFYWKSIRFDLFEREIVNFSTKRLTFSDNLLWITLIQELLRLASVTSYMYLRSPGFKALRSRLWINSFITSPDWLSNPPTYIRKP